MSASAIADAIVTVFSATCAFGPTGVSKDTYAHLLTNASSMLVGLIGLTSTTRGFGGVRHNTYSFQLDTYIRDTGDPGALLGKLWTAFDMVETVLRDNQTLLDTCEEVQSIEFSHRPGSNFSLDSGETWLFFNTTIQVLEFM